jgi:hypothetical protein
VEGLASTTAERERPLRGQRACRHPLPWPVTGAGSTEATGRGQLHPVAASSAVEEQEGKVGRAPTSSRRGLDAVAGGAPARGLGGLQPPSGEKESGKRGRNEARVRVDRYGAVLS